MGKEVPLDVGKKIILFFYYCHLINFSVFFNNYYLFLREENQCIKKFKIMEQVAKLGVEFSWALESVI